MVVSVETPTKLLFVLGTPKQKALFISKTKRKMKTLNEVAAAIKEDEKTPFNTDAFVEFVKEEPGFYVIQTFDNVIYNYIMAHDGKSYVDMSVFVHDVWSLVRLRNVFLQTAIDNGQATQENIIKYFNTFLAK